MRKYEVVEAAPYCCVCAVIESILKRHGYTQTQYDVANAIGIVVPESELEKLPSKITNIMVSNDVSKCGIHLYNETLTNYFKENGIALKETYISAQMISDINFESILETVSDDFDVLLFFDYGVLHGNVKNWNVGHCVLFIEKDGNCLKYQDPGPLGLGVNVANIDDMLDAIKASAGGITIISPLMNISK